MLFVSGSQVTLFTKQASTTKWRVAERSINVGIIVVFTLYLWTIYDVPHTHTVISAYKPIGVPNDTVWTGRTAPYQATYTQKNYYWRFLCDIFQYNFKIRCMNYVSYCFPFLLFSFSSSFFRHPFDFSLIPFFHSVLPIFLHLILLSSALYLSSHLCFLCLCHYHYYRRHIHYYYHCGYCL